MNLNNKDISPTKKKHQHKSFWPRVSVGQPWECWEWEGPVNRSGYGLFSLDGDQAMAHRMAWWLGVGEVFIGGNICHHCDNPGCCNPAHLFMGTQKQNVLDMIDKGRGFWQKTNID